MRESPSPQLPQAYRAGDLISGRYRLEKLLGEGGMGAVWRARNVALESPVAIKLLGSKIQEPTLRQRLLLEARAAAKLTHPAIVKVFDVGQTEREEPYIVMELLEGTSLGAILETEGRLSAIQAVRTLLPIADALRLAHNKGIVHRDVKPDNIFIVHDEAIVQPKLVDFGIVKVQGGDGAHTLTREGSVMGSPTYLSPEQARGDDDVDQRSDIWALSVVLFEAISGRPPFEASNYNALLRKILDEEPPSLRELLAADEKLSSIVARGLIKAREQRFQSMNELGRALARWLLRQGEPNDISGISVQGKWLREASASDAFATPWRDEPGSGVRRPIPIPPSTIPAAANEPATERPPVEPRRRRLWLLGAGVAVAAMAVFWLASMALPRPPVPNPAPLPVTATHSSLEPLTPPSPASAEAAPPSTLDADSAAGPTSAAPSSSALRPSPGRRQPKPKPKPKSDLMRPY